MKRPVFHWAAASQSPGRVVGNLGVGLVKNHVVKRLRPHMERGQHLFGSRNHVTEQPCRR